MKKFLLSTLAILGMASTAFAGTGTADDPYTVAEILSKMEGGFTGTAVVKGYITKITTKEANFNQYYDQDYYIADTPNGTPEFYIYNGYYLNGAKFTSMDQIKVGDLVVVEGTCTVYEGTLEFGRGSKILSLNGEVGTAPETPSTPEGTAVTFDFSDPTLYGFNPGDATEIPLDGKTISKDGVTITFAQEGSAQTGIRLFKSSAGQWSFRFYKDTSFTVTTPEGNHLNGIVFAGKDFNVDWSYSSGTFAVDTWLPTVETNTVTIGKTKTGNNPVIDSMTVYYSDGEFVPSEPGTPGTPDNAQYVTFNFGDPTAYGFNPGEEETEIPLDGKTFTKDGVTITFTQEDSTSTAIRLFKSSKGQWSFRFYKGTTFTVTAPDGYNLSKMEFAGNNIGTDWSYSNGALSGTTWTPSSETNTVTIGKTATGNNPIIDTLTVYYVQGAGVEEILAADDSEAVYFNLQGQKVNNPERGIFIKVVNGKAIKVVK